MKYLLTTVAAACLSTTVMAADFNENNPISTTGVIDSLNEIADISPSGLDLTELSNMLEYTETVIREFRLLAGDLSFGGEVMIDYPEAVYYDYPVLSLDTNSFDMARDAFLEEIDMFFVGDGVDNFALNETNEGALGVLANAIVKHWDDIKRSSLQLANNPQDSSAWTLIQASAEEIQLLVPRYNALHAAYETFKSEVEAWDKNEAHAHLANVNKEAKDEILGTAGTPVSK